MPESFVKTAVMLRECFAMSWDNIRGNKARSFLTILGILIGVSAVIALISTVSGFSGELSSSFQSMGVGTLNVSVTGSDLKYGMDAQDLAELAALDEVDGITPIVSLKSQASRDGKYEEKLHISGKNAFWFGWKQDAMVRGRGITSIDEENCTYVCLINGKLVKSLFYGVDPIGKAIYLNGLPFTVTGILKDDASMTVADIMSGRPDIVIPYTTALKMINANTVSAFTVYLSNGVNSENAKNTISDKMDEMFSFEEDCFKITTMSPIEDTMKSLMSMLSKLLGGIASIALVVGGIGIMNMMLTTVTERKVEIGLKKALGAIPWQIQAQFLIESFLLSIIGGILGIGMGIILTLIICRDMGITFAVSAKAILLGVGFSAAVGIIFGWAPARKASKLNPIDALRSN